MDVVRRHLRLGIAAGPHRHQRGQASRHLVLPHQHPPARGGRAPAQAGDGEPGVLRGLHDRRARREERPRRPARPGLGDRPDDAVLRARRQFTRTGDALHLGLPRAGEGRARPPSRRPSAHRRPTRPRQARPHLRRAGGPALRGAAGPVSARQGRGPGRGLVDHQALRRRVREALLRAGARDPRPVRSGHGGTARAAQYAGERVVGSRRDVGVRVPLVAGRHHLLRLVRDPEERDRRARARPAQRDAGRSGEVMDFAFSGDQQLLKNAARAFLDERCTSPIVRGLWDDPRGESEAMWKDMAQLGWLGLSLPEAYGGSGLGMVETAILLEEMGRAAYPGPYLPTVLAAPATAAAGTKEQKARWLPGIATGGARATSAFVDSDLSWDPATTATRAEKAGTGWRLSGAKQFVAWAHVADVVLVPARAPEGLTLFLVEPASAGLALKPVTAIDLGTRWAAIALDNGSVGPHAGLGAPGSGERLVTELLRRGSVAASAEMLGAARRCLDMSVGYAKVREQFGQPIGSFQAIRHKCAEMLLEVENSHAAVYYAAWALYAAAPDAALHASAAKSYVSEAARRVCGEALQVHGGS